VLQAQGGLANKRVGICYRGKDSLVINGGFWSACPAKVVSTCNPSPAADAGTDQNGVLSVLSCQVAP
jgi:hypothetical protein